MSFTASYSIALLTVYRGVEYHSGQPMKETRHFLGCSVWRATTTASCHFEDT
jgi:hypothetical protein